MQRIENADYYHARNACYLCLQPHDGVDTSIQIEYEGVLFICRGCCGELARTAGYDLSDNRAEIAGLKAKLADESERADAAEHRLDQIRTYDGRVDSIDKARAAKKATV